MGMKQKRRKKKENRPIINGGDISMTLLGPTSGDIQTLRSEETCHGVISIIRPSIPFPANIL
jgi:hypothetical protein